MESSTKKCRKDKICTLYRYLVILFMDQLYHTLLKTHNIGLKIGMRTKLVTEELYLLGFPCYYIHPGAV